MFPSIYLYPLKCSFAFVIAKHLSHLKTFSNMSASRPAFPSFTHPTKCILMLLSCLHTCSMVRSLFLDNVKKIFFHFNLFCQVYAYTVVYAPRSVTMGARGGQEEEYIRCCMCVKQLFASLANNNNNKMDPTRLQCCSVSHVERILFYSTR